HQRCAKREDYPMCIRLAMISFKSLRLLYSLNKTHCCLAQTPR
ncbi:RNA methyltransferase, partial [Pectobacterium atrosepticum]|nr:RNA methyltransferase [Pectobacterium atrosepticum]